MSTCGRPASASASTFEVTSLEPPRKYCTSMPYFCLEGGDDGVDDLGVEARVEQDLALGLRLGDVDLAGFGRARRPAPSARGPIRVSVQPAASPLITERRAIRMSASLAQLWQRAGHFFLGGRDWTAVACMRPGDPRRQAPARNVAALNRPGN